MSQDDPQRKDTIATSAGTLTVAPARFAEVDALVAIHEAAAASVRARGYDPGEPPRPLRDIVAARTASGEQYLARLDAAPAAALTLQWRDRAIWGDVPDDAAYVHGLMVAPALAGRRIGRYLLRWAERQAAAAGKPYTRLDCRADNLALRAYYARAGFAGRGEVALAGHAYVGARFERRVPVPERLQTPLDAVILAPAEGSDADALLALLEEAARWLTARGIDQWRPGIFARGPLLDEIAAGERFVARWDGVLAGTLRLCWDDPATWGTQPPDAGYVHGLAVARTFAGRALGRALLDWAARAAADAGKTTLRLDCVAHNAPLRAYYQRAGFTVCGEVDGGTLFERRLAPG